MSVTEEEVKVLREEILESEKAQAELLKWKLIAVAAVASVALGINHPGSDRKELICVIPLVCAYVDLLSLHLMMRIITIGAFLRSRGNPYEKYVFGLREKREASAKSGTAPDFNPFVFEAWALYGSSSLFNLGILSLGLSGLAGLVKATNSWVYLVAGAVGLILTGALHWQAKKATRCVPSHQS